MDDYQVVWLSVERDLDAKLRSPELLKHGAYMKHSSFVCTIKSAVFIWLPRGNECFFHL